MKIKRFRFIAIIGGLLFLMAAFFLAEKAEAKSYNYDSIKIDIQVNKDSTFDVAEKQTFNYQGEFHKGWRFIPYNKINAISDILVIDGETGRALIFSNSKLEPTVSTSRGKYAYYKSNGGMNIEWYYNLSDTRHDWIIKYKVHGGVGFYKDHDEIYWNLFSDYDAPVNNVEAIVRIPENNFADKDFQLSVYRNGGEKFSEFRGKVAYFSAQNIKPKEAVTVAFGWPKGLIEQKSFWLDFFGLYYGYIFSFLVAIITIITAFFRWLITEKLPKGRGTIIPEYAPPKNLRPAMAEVICKEAITPKAWAATAIDLAARGYLKIKEEKASKFEGVAILLIVLVFTFIIAYSANFNWVFLMILFGIILLFVARAKSQKGWKEILSPKTYSLEKIEGKNIDNLEDYEKSFFNLMFAESSHFSLKELKKNSSKAQEFHQEMKKIEKKLLEEVDLDTNAFESKISGEKWLHIGVVLIVMFFFAFVFTGVFAEQLVGFLITFLFCGIFLFLFFKYEARLSKEGRILKEEWLGFKLYLETAERYRMQNLTPETFEKYLPYAMIFGVEKKWGKAFESLSMDSPAWYSGALAGSAANTFSGGAGNFSASAFSASFSSSFSSAFASSGASGGGAGGGGDAGGGGGGGGGGAS